MPVLKVSMQRLLFVMPPEPEAFIAALAAVNAYVHKLNGGMIRTDVTLVAKRDWLTDMLVPLSYKMEDEVPSNKFDLAIDLAEERAKLLANPTSRTCASGFGTMLGFENTSELVHVSSNDPVYDLAIISWGETATLLCQAIKRLDPAANITLLEEDRVCIDDLLEARMVVSLRSVFTYLAACAGRAVVELYPQDEFEKGFYAKWSNPKYTMMLLESRVVSMREYSTLWINFQRIWRQFAQRRVGQPVAQPATTANQS